MTNETIKVLLMASMFGVLQFALHMPTVFDFWHRATKRMRAPWHTPAVVLRPVPVLRRTRWHV
jgi:hypothetical protein